MPAGRGGAARGPVCLRRTRQRRRLKLAQSRWSLLVASASARCSGLPLPARETISLRTQRAQLGGDAVVLFPVLTGLTAAALSRAGDPAVGSSRTSRSRCDSPRSRGSSGHALLCAAVERAVGCVFRVTSTSAESRRRASRRAAAAATGEVSPCIRPRDSCSALARFPSGSGPAIGRSHAVASCCAARPTRARACMASPCVAMAMSSPGSSRGRPGADRVAQTAKLVCRRAQPSQLELHRPLSVSDKAVSLLLTHDLLLVRARPRDVPFPRRGPLTPGGRGASRHSRIHRA